jgi:Ras-related protein Rab-6A
VFDITNKQTFLNCDKWVEDVRNERGNEANIVLVGNKIDKAEERAVSLEEADKKAKSFEATYIETSAKTGDNVKQLFKQIATTLPGDKPQPVSSGRIQITPSSHAEPVTAKGDCAC